MPVVVDSIIVNHPQRFDYGVGEIQIDESGALDDLADDIDEHELTQRVLLHFQSPSYQPPMLPRVALEMQQLAQRSDVDPQALMAVLAQDPLLAGRVLQRAQSAAFAGSSVTGPLTLRDAIAGLGVRNLRDVVWETALTMRVFRAVGPRGAQMQALSRHASTTAYIASVVATFSPFPSEYAFLCGLLHDIGIAATLLVLAERERDPRRASPPIVVVQRTLAKCHASISRLLAAKWKLPDDVQWVIGAHHAIELGGMVHPLAAIVSVADELARRVGHGADTITDGENLVDAEAPGVFELALRTLKIDSRRLLMILQDVKRHLDRTNTP